MGSVTNISAGLAYLTGTGGLLAKLPANLPASALQSAPAQDVAKLSDAALEAQQAGLLFGDSSATQRALVLPALSATSSSTIPGVASSDISNASSQQQAEINDQALLLQQTQDLFGVQSTATGLTNFVG
jgi:hypothetical protein